MKSEVCLLATLLPFGLNAQLAATKTDPTVIVPYRAVISGPHERVWQSVTVDAPGVTNTHSYTEIASGLNYWNEQTGAWEETQEQFQITADGYAVATKGQHKAIVAPDIATRGAVDLLGPDGQRLLSNPMGLVFRDLSSGKTVLIAEVTNCIGELAAPNMVFFARAFDSVRAGLSYTYSKGGFEQDVILYQKLPSPADYGLSPATTVLETWTEFLNPPSPAIKTSERTSDQTLDFGQTRMGSGVAYVQNASESETVPLQKAWGEIEGRYFLIESIRYGKLKPLLDKLQAGIGTPKKTQAAQTTFPDRRKLVAEAFRGKSKLVQQASIRPGRPSGETGVVLDYQTLNTSKTNFTFQGDTTYYVSGSISLLETTIFEGGAVIKITNSASININGPVNCKTSPYRPGVLTSRNDDSVGETITGSTGNPTNSGFYGKGGLEILTSGNILHDFRFAYSTHATDLGFEVGEIALTNVQFIYCTYPVFSDYDENTIRINNALFFSSYNVIKGGFDLEVLGQHWTVNRCNKVASKGSGLFTPSFGSLRLTNSIVIAATNGWGSSVTTNSTAFFTNDPGNIFQTVGAASHYLADNTYRDAGTTNINANLLASLRKKTTYPPIELTTNFTGGTTLAPQAQRDTDTPDLGYHYDPLDWIVTGRTLTNSTLTLTNGVALGTYGPSTSYGMFITKSGNLVSKGSPVNLNRITRYNTVQERATTNWSASTAGPCIKGDTLSPFAQGHFRFTDWSVVGGMGYHFYGSREATSTPQYDFTDCQFGPGVFYAKSCSTALTNCLFERVSLNLDNDADNRSYYVFNNLFRFGSLLATGVAGFCWICKDNLFDQTTITQVGTSVTHSNNAYISGFSRLTPTNANDVVLTNAPAYLSSYLGKYYYPVNDGMLSTLVNAGNTNADVLGLYHYTTQTNQTREGTSLVDIGFHYTAVDENGNPLDSDGNEMGDFLEDVNQNGIPDWLESAMGYNPLQTNNLGKTQPGFELFLAHPKTNSRLP